MWSRVSTPCPVFSSPAFSTRNLVRCFPVRVFHPCSFDGPAFSSPTFSVAPTVPKFDMAGFLMSVLVFMSWLWTWKNLARRRSQPSVPHGANYYLYRPYKRNAFHAVKPELLYSVRHTTPARMIQNIWVLTSDAVLYVRADGQTDIEAVFIRSTPLSRLLLVDLIKAALPRSQWKHRRSRKLREDNMLWKIAALVVR